jgi:hypothetical protein
MFPLCNPCRFNKHISFFWHFFAGEVVDYMVLHHIGGKQLIICTGFFMASMVITVS